MSLDKELIARLGKELHLALENCTVVEPLTERHPELTIEEAYAVQQAMVGHRLAAGQRIVGKKIGVTSKAVMNMLGVGLHSYGFMNKAVPWLAGFMVSQLVLMAFASIPLSRWRSFQSLSR